MANLPEKSEIKNAVDFYCETKAISSADLALQIGVSGATLSLIANGKWDSISQKMWQKVWNYVRPIEATNLYSSGDYAAIQNLCDKTKKNHFMSGLIGDTGTGKSVALQSYARKENVFYIYYDSNMRPKHFFYELGRLLGYDFEGNMYELVNKACNTLNQLESPLIIIDEASKLTDPMLMALHVLRDKTIRNCGIVVAGMPYFRSNLIKKSNKQKVGISEFLRRIMIWHELTGLTNSEIEFICADHGIDNKKTIAGFRTYKRFGDLMNAILLHNTINEAV